MLKWLTRSGKKQKSVADSSEEREDTTKGRVPISRTKRRDSTERGVSEKSCEKGRADEWLKKGGNRVRYCGKKGPSSLSHTRN